ncbi:VOC family protein [Caulobacter sp. 1776]|uniref:VOC family protein n=1 Tax=Caulobacter sp. 1776 TaxID=3156420 RepID=UPI0033961CEC
MIDHLAIRVRDFEASRRFYDVALAPLGLGVVMEVTPEATGGYHGLGYGSAGKPVFWLSNAVGSTTSDQTGLARLHVAFAAADHAAVDAFHKAALAQGGRDNGPPGVRAHYHPHYCAAFVLDPNGINVEAVCHLAP